MCPKVKFGFFALGVCGLVLMELRLVGGEIVQLFRTKQEREVLTIETKRRERTAMLQIKKGLGREV